MVYSSLSLLPFIPQESRPDVTQFTTSTLSLHVIGSYWTRLGEKDKFIAIEAFAVNPSLGVGMTAIAVMAAPPRPRSLARLTRPVRRPIRQTDVHRRVTPFT